MAHLETVSNGLGAPSLLLLLMAIRREIPATVAITADTGWENDRLWNTGRRSTNQEYFDEIVVPLCKGTHVEPKFVRVQDRHKQAGLGLGERVLAAAKLGNVSHIPMFGSEGGRLMQSCTEKMKIRAMSQDIARAIGSRKDSTSRSAQGIHFGEAIRRVKGRFVRMDGQWSVYAQATKRKIKGVKTEIVSKRLFHYYPLVDLKLDRAAIYKAIEAEGIPYLISSECDLCPHKDLSRWERTSPHIIEQGTEIETLLGGRFFFTDRRIPLKQAIEAMRVDAANKPPQQADIDFGCKDDICGI